MTGMVTAPVTTSLSDGLVTWCGDRPRAGTMIHSLDDYHYDNG